MHRTRVRQIALTLLVGASAAMPAAALGQSSDTRAPVLSAAVGRDLGKPYLVIRCDEACTVVVRIEHGGKTLARQSHHLRAGIPANEKLTVPAKAFGSATRLKVTLKLRATDSAGNAAATKTLKTTLKR
jgi:hypothetical protein